MQMNRKAKFLGADYVADPYSVHARLRQDKPVHRMMFREGLNCWLVTGYEHARIALADPRFSRDPRLAGPQWQEADRGRALEDGSALGVHLLTRDAPDHTRLRRLVSSAFTPRRTESWRPRVQWIADSLVDGFQARGSAELIGEYAYPLAITVICELLGLPLEDRDYFRQWTSNAVSPGPEDVPPARDYLGEVVAARRRVPGDDLISVLIAAAEEEKLSETELLSMVFLLLLAGHEGTVGLIGNAIVSLLDNPEQLALLRRRPELLDSAVDELLRYDGPMELAAWRFATEPVTFGGTDIPAGAPVVISLAGAHRDPARFTEPDRLSITRTDNPHLAFGHGAHYCLGAQLARLEGAIALATLFRRLPDLRLTVPAHEVRRQPSFVMRSLYELPADFTPTRSSTQG